MASMTSSSSHFGDADQFYEDLAGFIENSVCIHIAIDEINLVMPGSEISDSLHSAHGDARVVGKDLDRLISDVAGFLVDKMNCGIGSIRIGSCDQCQTGILDRADNPVANFCPLILFIAEIGGDNRLIVRLRRRISLFDKLENSAL